MNEPEIVVRRFEPGDERAVNAAFNASFGLERSLDEWSWKFPVEARGRLIMLAEQSPRAGISMTEIPLLPPSNVTGLPGTRRPT